MKKRRILFFLIFFLYAVIIASGDSIPIIDVKVNYLGDAEKFYIVQAVWLPDIEDSLITVFFNSDDKTFWRYVINSYNPLSEVYTTLFEEQENKNFYIKMFFYNNSEIVFLKKFVNNPFDTKDYVVFCNVKKRNRILKLFKDEKNRLQEKKNMLSSEIKGRLVNCCKSGCLKQTNSNLYLVNETKDKNIREEFLLEKISNAFIISGTNLILFERHGEYFIYSMDLKKILYKLNFIESYTKFKVEVINLLDFSPDYKYVLLETKSKYKGRNKKSVGILTKQILNKN